MRQAAKRIATVAAAVLALPAACLAGFGRWQEAFLFFGQTLAMIPGIPGSYLRIAYYRYTLDGVGSDCHMGFGSFFAHAKASMGSRVGIGAYCVLGQVSIEERTQLASGVQILSGSRQHRRAEDGRLTDEGRQFSRIVIGADCWIGAGATVMANVGAKATVGAGAVVAKEVPAGATVSGNPARSLSEAANSL